MPDPICQVYEQYKHLDHLLSDETWLAETMQGKMLGDFWQAIKAHLSPDEKFGPTQDDILRNKGIKE